MENQLTVFPSNLYAYLRFRGGFSHEMASEIFGGSQMNRRRSIFVVIAVLSLTLPGLSQTNLQKPVVRIGMVIDGYYELNEEYLPFWTKEILDLMRGEFDVQFPEDKIILADWTVEGVHRAMDGLLADPEVDLILAMGVIASQDVATRGDLPKPVIAPWILDAELMGFPYEDGVSGVKNFNYVNLPERTIRDIEVFLDITDFKKLAFLINDRYLEAIPELKTRGRDLLKDVGIDMEVIGVGETIDEALAELTPEIDAVVVSALTRTPRAEFDRLVDELIRRKLPSLSVFEARDIERGILASVIADVAQQIARRVALNIQRILLGEEPGSIPVNVVIGEQLKINMATARAIDVYPAWRVIIEAELINEERTDIARKISLSSVVHDAVDVNLDLAARERHVAAGLQNVNEARSTLLPQIYLSGNGVTIDRDRAESSFGAQAERSLSGAATVTQLIYSEPAFANLSIQKSLQKTREWDYEQLRLDIALAASTAYLNVLRAKTYERIQRDNLKRIRTSLGIARVRESTGMAGPAEVYRWESEMAINRKAAIQAGAERQLAEVQLNRLLHRPLEEPFITLEDDLTDQLLFTSEEYLRLTTDLKSLEIFRKFMVEEGLSASPELASLDAAITAQERILRSASNSFWLPTLALQGELSHVFSKGGVGSSADPIPGFPLSGLDDTSWMVAFNLSFPLFKGGEKVALRRKAQKELEYLRLQQKALREKIEQRILSAIFLTGASYVGIEQAQEAAKAAGKSLEIVQNAYSQGTVSILHLLDAQNAAFYADQAAANALYDFLIDLMEMERSTGRMEFFMDQEERTKFFERMQAFFKEHGMLEERP